jgi:hypothetical protein
MKIWKDKEGNCIEPEEFVHRFKMGLDGITPLQKIKSQINGTRIMLIGLVLGLVMSLIAYKNFWWVAIILLGGIINTGIQYLSLVQQKNMLENIEKSIGELQ